MFRDPKEDTMNRSRRTVWYAPLYVAIFGVLGILAVPCLAQAPRPAVPIDAIAAIVEAFDSHDVVALSEGVHKNEQGHALRLSLIRDPRFTTVVNDIVVEFGGKCRTRR